MAERWTVDVLDAMRLESDPLATRCVAALEADRGLEATALIFATMSASDAELPADAPKPLADFFAATRELPPGTDAARIRRGEQVFTTHAFVVAVVLMTKSLPAGYAAPNLTKILAISGDLIRSPYRRLLGVLEMLVNVCASQGWEPGGKVVVTAQKLRLLHEGVRRITRRRLPDFEPRYGVPVNHGDMLATIVAFSFLVIEGMRRLRIGLTREQEEDYYYLWRVFAELMGLAADRIPRDIDDAAAFYDAYARRHYVGADVNPDGATLARANLRMLRRMVPRSLRWLGLGLVPRLYMGELLRRSEVAQIGLTRLPGHSLTWWLLRRCPWLWRKPWQDIDRIEASLDGSLGRVLFQGMIDRERNGEVRFLVPDTLADLRKLA